ncbi:MAG: hypothetical protein J3R72DRAFT_213738 [Linnemannia gamsii]|nr:MAG: hypothetical protein J3R72DRAFT_213738 [Linnemannia gamsii]
MTAIKPSVTDPSRTRPRANPSSSLINNNNPSSSLTLFPSSSSPSPSSPPPSPSAHTHTHSNNNSNLTTASATTTSNNNINNITNTTTSTSNHIPRTNANHPHSGQDHRVGRAHRQSHIHNRSHNNSHSHRHNNHSSNTSQRTHVRRHSASAYYAGPVEQDRVIRTINAHAEAAASGILSPRLRSSRLLLSPRGPQPQRHLHRHQRQQQQQQQSHRQLPRIPIFQHYHQQSTNSQRPLFSNPSTVSPSSSVSVVSPLINPRSSSMPLIHTHPLERQNQEEAIVTLRQAQPLPLQPPFYRLIQQSQQLRPLQQPQQDLHQDLDTPIDVAPPDAHLIRQKLLQLQEVQLHQEKQQEQRLMQAYRIKKFSDSNNDLDYHTLSNFKEGFEQVWGESIVQEVEEEVERKERQLDSRRTGSITRQEEHDVHVAGSGDHHEHGDIKERLRQHRQQEQELMETDSIMDTEKTGDGEGDEEMDPQSRLEHARKVREDAIKIYEEAGRKLQRAREREEAIMYEYEAGLFAVEVGSSASQHIHPRQGHEHQNFSSLIEQQRDSESRSRHSSPTTTAAAAAAVSFQIQDDSNNEAMLSSRIVPQVSDTPSVFSETPRPHNIDNLTSQPIIGPPPVPASVPMSVSATSEQILDDLHHHRQRLLTAQNQVLNQMKSRSQSRSTSHRVPNEDMHTPQQQRPNSSSPRVNIKSEEQDESIYKSHFLDGEYKAGQSSTSQRPKYADFDIIIDIPSSVGSEVGMGGQPESSNAHNRREQEGKSGRRMPDRWRAPTPMPPSTPARHGKDRQHGLTSESTRPAFRFKAGGTVKVAPVDLLADKSGSSQQQRPHGSSSSRQVLQSPPRSFVPRPRPYPPPLFMPGRRLPQAQAPGSGLPPSFFARGMPTRPLPPPSPSSPHQPRHHQQQRSQSQGRSSPMMAEQTTTPAAAEGGRATPAPAFAGQTPSPGYASTSSPQTPWRIPDFVDENGYPYPTVIFYTHIDRIDHYHHHYPNMPRDISSSPRMSRASPNVFARPPSGMGSGAGGGGGGMEDVQSSSGDGYEDMVMNGEHLQSHSRASSRQSRGHERDEDEEREHKPPAKKESTQF